VSTQTLIVECINTSIVRGLKPMSSFIPNLAGFYITVSNIWSFLAIWNV